MLPVYYIPSFKELSLADLNRSYGSGLYLVGLTDRLTSADLDLKNSWNFFVHDLAHAQVNLGYATLFNRNQSYAAAAYDPRSPENVKFRKKLSRKISRVKDPDQRLLLHILVFEICHESGWPATLGAFEYVLKDPASLFNRIQSGIVSKLYGEKISTQLAGKLLRPSKARKRASDPALSRAAAFLTSI
jgi:hypothetical protein